MITSNELALFHAELDELTTAPLEDILLVLSAFTTVIDRRIERRKIQRSQAAAVLERLGPVWDEEPDLATSEAEERLAGRVAATLGDIQRGSNGGVL